MKRFLIFIVLAIVIVLIIGAIVFLSQDANSSNPNSYSEGNSISNTSSFTNTSNDTNVNEEIAENRISNIIENKNEIMSNITNETELSSFATTIKDKEEGRLTNINITCTTLNNTIVHSGTTFSFNETVGKPTSERGYQEASVIIDHKTEKGIGGRKLPSK